MEDIEKITVKVVNHLTGEITELNISSASKAKDVYLELTASETAIKKAKKQLASLLDNWLGQDQEYKFGDGKLLRRVQRESRQWTIEGLKKAGLDADAIAVISKVDMTAAKELVKEMQERGVLSPNVGKVLDEYAEVKATKPFVEIR